jgi:hypothetical protein
LHEDRAKTIGAPVGLQEGELSVVIASETRAGGDAKLHVLEELAKRRCPFGWRNRFAMVLLDKLAEGLEFDLEPRAIFIIKVAKLNKRMQSLTSSRKRPVVDHVELRLGWAVAIAGKVMADIFDACLEEVAFAELER